MHAMYIMDIVILCTVASYVARLQIIVNPPFIGATMMNAVQKAEAVVVFGKVKLSNSIDYVGAWYVKAAAMMQGTKIKTAFVSTNSITQGEQVAPLWRQLLDLYNVNIQFAYRTFVWNSEAKDKAAVHCVIIGFSVYESKEQKTIFFEKTSLKCRISTRT